MMILRLLIACMITTSAFAAESAALPPFDGDVTVLRYVGPDGRAFEAQRVNYTNPVHYAAAQAIYADSKHAMKDLLNNFPQFNEHKSHQVGLIQARQDVVNSLPSYPFQPYLLFDDRGGMIGTFGLGIPKAFTDIMGLKEIDEAMHDMPVTKANVTAPISSVAKPEDSLATYSSLVLYILEEYRGTQIIPVFSPVMVRMLYQLVDSLREKACPIIKFEEGKFSADRSPVPLGGLQATVPNNKVVFLSPLLSDLDVVDAPENLEVIPSSTSYTLAYPLRDGRGDPVALRGLKEKILVAMAEREAAMTAKASAAS